MRLEAEGESGGDHPRGHYRRLCIGNPTAAFAGGGPRRRAGGAGRPTGDGPEAHAPARPPGRGTEAQPRFQS
eukprot:3380383-Pleurochrysis_carterae.AAC.1